MVVIMLADALKFILGFFLAIAILAVGGAAAALYFMNKSSVIPAKPVFVNDSTSLKAQVPASAVIGSTSTQEPETKKAPVSSPKATAKASPKVPSPKPLPPGAYAARVTWRQGLVMRGEAKQDAERVGSVGYNQKILVLEESSDQAWQKIRTPDGKIDGWVKAGNTKKDDGQNQTQKPEQTDDSEQQR